MTNEELIARLQDIDPSISVDAGEWPNAHIEATAWPVLAPALRLCDELAFDYLFCLTCVDWKTHLTMVYHLTSTRHRHHLVVKSKLDREAPSIRTVSDIWRTAEFHEREVFEMFGVHFEEHPDLRKLILPDDWQGYPLRKDYEDPVNMIKL
ncbi:MAG: NADH-quinone oxidoreductase subunit C [Bacteroidetes bacterium]|nr:NADH-quinone oxidoreductase subunit C [Bacteroidota bacterium]